MERDTIRTEHLDVEKALKRAAELLRDAGTLSGEKAEALRARAKELIDAVAAKTGDAARATRHAAEQADEFVQANPWKAVAIGAGVGLLLGALLRRR